MHLSPTPDQIYLKSISTVQTYNTEGYHTLSYFVEILYVRILQSLEELYLLQKISFFKPCFVSLPFCL